MRLGAGILAVVLGASACGSSGTAPDDARPNAPFTTDAATYTATRTSSSPRAFTTELTIGYRYTNATEAPIQLNQCPSLTVGPLIAFVYDDGHQSTSPIGYNNTSGACLSGLQPIVVAPGETRRDSFRAVGSTILDANTNLPIWTMEGQFRLAVEAKICPTPTTCTPAPDAQLRSTPFTVRLR